MSIELTDRSKIAWETLPLPDVYHELGVQAGGLSETKAAHIRARTGRNELTKRREKTAFDYFLRELANPLSLILVFAGLTTFFLSSLKDAVVIFIAVAINVVIGTIEEYQADRAFLALQKLETKRAIVVRDGKKKVIDASELVPGDHVLLEAGSSIPADIRVSKAGELLVNESILSGEWEPVDKSEGVSQAKGDRHNLLFMGTLVLSGHAEGVVVRTGEKTMLGEIADSLKKEPEKTPFEKSTAAQVAIIKYITAFEINIPVQTSTLILRISFMEVTSLRRIVVLPCRISSSTSCDVCQKKR